MAKVNYYGYTKMPDFFQVHAVLSNGRVNEVDICSTEEYAIDRVTALNRKLAA